MKEVTVMPNTFWTALSIGTALTVLLLVTGIAAPFGALPGDLRWQSETVTVIMPLLSSSLVILTVYGLLRLIEDLRRLR